MPLQVTDNNSGDAHEIDAKLTWATEEGFQDKMQFHNYAVNSNNDHSSDVRNTYLPYEALIVLDTQV